MWHDSDKKNGTQNGQGLPKLRKNGSFFASFVCR